MTALRDVPGELIDELMSSVTPSDLIRLRLGSLSNFERVEHTSPITGQTSASMPLIRRSPQRHNSGHRGPSDIAPLANFVPRSISRRPRPSISCRFEMSIRETFPQSVDFRQSAAEWASIAVATGRRFLAQISGSITHARWRLGHVALEIATSSRPTLALRRSKRAERSQLSSWPLLSASATGLASPGD